MKKTLLLAACAMLLSACGIDYQGSVKLIFEGRVVDEAGNPLAGIPVQASISDGDDIDFIGTDETDSNGNYRMIFPGASEDVTFVAYVNFTEFYEEGPLPWSNTRIYNIPQEQVKGMDYLINFGETALYEVDNSVNLLIEYVHNGSTNFHPDKILLKGLVNNHDIDYNFDSDIGLDTEPTYYVESYFQVARNQVLTLQYSYQDGIIHEVQIPVGEEDLTYTLNF